MPARKVKATIQQLTEDLENGLIVPEIMGKYGYTSLDSTRSILYRFGLMQLAKLNEEKRPAPSTDKHAKSKEADKQFRNAIAYQDWSTGEKYNRIDEFWDHERYTTLPAEVVLDAA